MEGVSSEWAKRHPDVDILMEMDHKTLTYKISMIDKAHAGRVVKKEYPISSIPFDQGELVLEDWICSSYEQLYYEIKSKRDKKEL